MRTPALLATSLVAATVVTLTASGGVAFADPPPSPVSGAACAPGTGVTVVVDFTPFDGDVEIGCAVGAQVDGFAALADAGFTIDDTGSGPGTVCTIDGLPAEGYPFCWLTGGYWSYWRAEAGDPWAFSETGAGGTGTIPVDSVEGWIFHRADEGWGGDTPACGTAPDAPVLTIIADDETLPFSTVDAIGTEIAVLAPSTTPPDQAVFAQAEELDLAPYSGQTIRVLARRSGAAEQCSEPLTFDATYEVRDTYAPRAGTEWNPAPPTANNPDIVAWASGAIDVAYGANSTNPSYQVPANATGPSNGSLLVLGDRGQVTLTFDAPFGDYAGYDLVVVENGFASGAGDFLELAYVEVSSNGTDFARFDTASRQPTPVGGFQAQPANLLGGMGGRDITTGVRYGTPFDLAALANDTLVRSGLVDLDAITHVRIVDIHGDGGDLDSFGRPIYDATPTSVTGGFDLDAVGVLRSSPNQVLAWIEGELTDNGGRLPSPFDPSAADWGITLDAVLALNRGGRGAAAPATTALSLLEEHVDDYITGEAYGDPGVYAGPLGKTFLAAVLQGADVSDFGGRDLEALSRAAVQTTGLHVGRFSDQGSPYGNYSNGFGHTLNMLALSHTDGGVPGSAITFLLDQQCPNGSFRLFYDAFPAENTTRGCVTDAESDADATALALAALRSVEPGPAITAAIDDAVAWLLTLQDPVSGAFHGTPPTDAANSNTTGLAVHALAALGITEPADDGAAWIDALRLTAPATTGTPAAGDEGAIAYNPAARDAALAEGIDAMVRDQWRRATAQAVLAYDFPPFGADAPDAAAPSLTVSAAPASPAAADATFTLTTDDPAATFACELDGGPVVPCTSPLELTGLADGEHTLDVVALDPSGNPSATATRAWSVDSTGPVVSIATALPSETTATSASFTVTSAEAGVTIECRLDGGSWAPCATPQTYTGLSLGAHEFDARGTDSLGNTGALAAFAWTIVAPVEPPVETPPAVTPVTPGRVVDTRPGGPVVDGGVSGTGALAAGSVFEFSVAGVAAVPDDAAAVVLNVTAVNANAPGYLTVWDCSEPRPVASSVNYTDGSPSPNAVIVSLSGTGSVCVFTLAGVDVVVDVNGYLAEGAGFGAAGPARVADTRPGWPVVEGGLAGSGALAPRTVLEVPVAGLAGVPNDAAAVVLNVTSVNATAPGYLTVWDCSEPRPVASSVNYVDAAPSPNAVIVGLSDAGSVCVFTLAGADVIVDVNGYLESGAAFGAAGPARVADSRPGEPVVEGGWNGSGPQAAGWVLEVPVAGLAGVPEGAEAVVLNVTAVNATAPGYLTLWDCSEPRPVASSVNYVDAAPSPNAVIVGLSDVGSVCVFTLAGADVIIDVNGYTGVPSTS